MSGPHIIGNIATIVPPNDENFNKKCKELGISNELIEQCRTFAKVVLGTEGAIGIDKPSNCESAYVRKRKGEVTFLFRECIHGQFKNLEVVRKIKVCLNGTISVKGGAAVSSLKPDAA